MLSEIKSNVIDHLCDLINPQISVMPMLWQKSDWRILITRIILSTLNILSTLSILSILIFLIILMTPDSWCYLTVADYQLQI